MKSVCRDSGGSWLSSFMTQVQFLSMHWCRDESTLFFFFSFSRFFQKVLLATGPMNFAQRLHFAFDLVVVSRGPISQTSP